MFSLYPSFATTQSKPQLLLCAPKIAGLLPAPKPTLQSVCDKIDALWDEFVVDVYDLYDTYQREMAEIDARHEARLAYYGLSPRTITVTPPKGGSST